MSDPIAQGLLLGSCHLNGGILHLRRQEHWHALSRSAFKKLKHLGTLTCLDLCFNPEYALAMQDTKRDATLGRTKSPEELLRSAMVDIAWSWYPGTCGKSGETLADLEAYALDSSYSFEGQDLAQRAYRKIEKALFELRVDKLGVVEEAVRPCKTRGKNDR